MEQIIKSAINSGAVHLQHLGKSLLQPDATGGVEQAWPRVMLALAAANILLLLLWPTGRRFVINALDTMLAIVLIACLVGIVIGLPIGMLCSADKRCAFTLCTSCTTISTRCIVFDI